MDEDSLPDISYSIAGDADSDEIVELLATVFSESEPPAVAAGLTFADMRQLLRLITPGIVSLSLTVVAREKGSGELAGALLTDDFAAPPKLDPTQISRRFAPIFSMLEELDEQFRRERVVLPGECLHLFMLGVERRFAGFGIAKSMVAACLENGIRAGYRAAVTEATGKISQHVFRGQGFRERFRVSYRNFRHAQKAVFAGISEHDGALLMEKSLG
ncbi:MAG TPA: GNAT family N-acetyltransferase [Terriglobales bacterium]|nr:GNAT family N-acetyltransferase [Terriglobales bacterium]